MSQNLSIVRMKITQGDRGGVWGDHLIRGGRCGGGEGVGCVGAGGSFLPAVARSAPGLSDPSPPPPPFTATAIRTMAAHPAALLAVAELLLAHDRDIAALRAQLELCVLVDGAPLKAALLREYGLEGGAPPRVRAFRLVVTEWRRGGVPGSGRLAEAGDQDLERLLLRFRPVFRAPLEGRSWRWSLVLGQAAGAREAEGLADAAAHGGTEGALIRRPRQGMGPRADALERELFPARAAERDAKGKAKGKGRGGKGKNKGGGRGGGGGGGRGGGRAWAMPERVAEGAAAAGAEPVAEPVAGAEPMAGAADPAADADMGGAAAPAGDAAADDAELAAAAAAVAMGAAAAGGPGDTDTEEGDGGAVRGAYTAGLAPEGPARRPRARLG